MGSSSSERDVACCVLVLLLLAMVLVNRVLVVLVFVVLVFVRVRVSVRSATGCVVGQVVWPQRRELVEIGMHDHLEAVGAAGVHRAGRQCR